jgi:hypothetical protein
VVLALTLLFLYHWPFICIAPLAACHGVNLYQNENKFDPTELGRKQYLFNAKRFLLVKATLYTVFTLWFLFTVTISLISLFMQHPLELLKAFHMV